jgi:hypothetical protein
MGKAGSGGAVVVEHAGHGDGSLLAAQAEQAHLLKRGTKRAAATEAEQTIAADVLGRKANGQQQRTGQQQRKRTNADMGRVNLTQAEQFAAAFPNAAAAVQADHARSRIARSQRG